MKYTRTDDTECFIGAGAVLTASNHGISHGRNLLSGKPEIKSGAMVRTTEVAGCVARQERRTVMIGEMQTRKSNEASETILLDPEKKNARAQEFAESLGARIVGQDQAVRQMSNFYQIFLAGMNPTRRPVGTMLFLGPTGSGKTRVIEAAAEALFNDPNAMIKIDCAEFQHSHEIAKLIGSPPGYLGHRETSPLLSQENVNRTHTDDVKLSLVLFDEIEKASDSLWQLLLGILKPHSAARSSVKTWPLKRS